MMLKKLNCIHERSRKKKDHRILSNVCFIKKSYIKYRTCMLKVTMNANKSYVKSALKEFKYGL